MYDIFENEDTEDGVNRFLNIDDDRQTIPKLQTSDRNFLNLFGSFLYMVHFVLEHSFLVVVTLIG